MTATESSIIDKLTSEIEGAAGDARSKLITDLWTVMCTMEKRVALEARSFGTKLAGEAKTAASAVEGEWKTISGEIAAHL